MSNASFAGVIGSVDCFCVHDSEGQSEWLAKGDSPAVTYPPVSPSAQRWGPYEERALLMDPIGIVQILPGLSANTFQKRETETRWLESVAFARRRHPGQAIADTVRGAVHGDS